MLVKTEESLLNRTSDPALISMLKLALEAFPVGFNAFKDI